MTIIWRCRTCFGWTRLRALSCKHCGDRPDKPGDRYGGGMQNLATERQARHYIETHPPSRAPEAMCKHCFGRGCFVCATVSA